MKLMAIWCRKVLCVLITNVPDLSEDAFVNSPHSKLSLTNRGKEAVFSGLGRAWGPVFAYY